MFYRFLIPLVTSLEMTNDHANASFHPIDDRQNLRRLGGYKRPYKMPNPAGSSHARMEQEIAAAHQKEEAVHAHMLTSKNQIHADEAAIASRLNAHSAPQKHPESLSRSNSSQSLKEQVQRRESIIAEDEAHNIVAAEQHELDLAVPVAAKPSHLGAKPARPMPSAAAEKGAYELSALALEKIMENASHSIGKIAESASIAMKDLMNSEFFSKENPMLKSFNKPKRRPFKPPMGSQSSEWSDRFLSMSSSELAKLPRRPHIHRPKPNRRLRA